MDFQALVYLYERKRKKYGDSTFKYVSELLKEAKKLHKKDWLKSPTPGKDHEQSLGVL